MDTFPNTIPECEADAHSANEPTAAHAAFAAEFRKLVSARQVKMARLRDQDYELRGEVYRAEGRLRYRRERKAVGEVVRKYERVTNESASASGGYWAFKKEQDRDRQRKKRGVTVDSVRAYTRLSELTPEEKQAHERAKATARKNAQRRKSKAAEARAEFDLAVSEDQAELDQIVAELTL